MKTQQLNILVFGATRNTGFYVMQQALDAGHKVTAIIRNPAAFQYTHSNLTIVKGDATQINTFEKEVPGKDAIISSLGAAGFSQPTTLCSTGVKNMLQTMRNTGVKRIICVSASAIELNSQMNFFIRNASKVLQRLFKYPYSDLKLMENMLGQSDTNWTVVRPPQLKSMPVTGKYRISVGGHLKSGYSIGRPDLAHYMLNHINSDGTFRKIVEIAY